MLTLLAAGCTVALTDQSHVINGPILKMNMERNITAEMEGMVEIRVLEWEEPVWEGETPVVVVASDCYFFFYLAEPLIRSIIEVAGSSTRIL